MAEKKLRVGVIGVGYVSKNNFLPVLPRFDDVEFVGLMAGKLENAQHAQRLCGAQHAVDTLEAFVSLGLDCAFVLTPKQCHAEQIAFVLMAIIIYIILERTKYGTSIYAIGGNATAAKVSGINVRLCNFMGYVIAGICTGVAAVVLTARMRSGNPSVGNAYEMDAITCVILGGASFSGGSGKVVNTVFGALILGILVNGMTMLQIDSNLQSVVKGAVIVIAVFLDSRKRTD